MLFWTAVYITYLIKDQLEALSYDSVSPLSHNVERRMNVT